MFKIKILLLTHTSKMATPVDSQNISFIDFISAPIGVYVHHFRCPLQVSTDPKECHLCTSHANGGVRAFASIILFADVKMDETVSRYHPFRYYEIRDIFAIRFNNTELVRLFTNITDNFNRFEDDSIAINRRNILVQCLPPTAEQIPRILDYLYLEFNAEFQEYLRSVEDEMDERLANMKIEPVE